MPELPEVETVVGDLNRRVAGCYISGFWSDWEKALRSETGSETSAQYFNQKLAGDRIKKFTRRGKNILMRLESGRVVWIHLKMTGHLLVKTRSQKNKEIPLAPLLCRQAGFHKEGTGKEDEAGGADQYQGEAKKELGATCLRQGFVEARASTDQPKKKKKGEVAGGYFAERVNQYIHHIWYLSEMVQSLKRQDEVGGVENTDQQEVEIPLTPLPCRQAGFHKGRADKDAPKDFDLTLEFSDLRKFGKIRLFENYAQAEKEVLAALGEEPLSKEFTFAKFKEILKQSRRRNLRALLLDQFQIVGIGNIYASEILFEAGVSPYRAVGSLQEQEARAVFDWTKKILRLAIKERGTSDSDYRDTQGAPGNYQNLLKVYGKEGQPCPRKGCPGEIRRDKIGQRSAFWCEGCQG